MAEHRPVERLEQRALSESQKWWRVQVRALCCRCGMLRTTTRSGGTGEAYEGYESGGRCLVWRKCATCGEKTDHAYLRDDDGEYANNAERRQRPVFDVATEVDLLRSCGVRVRYDSGPWADDEAGEIWQYLDDGVYVLVMNPAATPTGLRAAVEFMWSLAHDPQGAPWVAWPARPDKPRSRPRRMVVLRRRA